MDPVSSRDEYNTRLKHMSPSTFLLLLILNTINSTITFGCLPSLSTYALLPFGQKAFYYWSVLIPSAYPLSLVISIRWKIASNGWIGLLSAMSWLLSGFIIFISIQSPCPWLADTISGALMIISVWFLMSTIGGFIRIIIGNRIKGEWSDEKGMFYYGASVQLGLFLGTIPTYIAINVFSLFVDRKPCKVYCVTNLE